LFWAKRVFRMHLGLARIGHINRAVNFSIRGIKNAPPGEWTSPLAALAEGAGDCKQHAVLKYVALRDAGFSPDSVRIVIVGDNSLSLVCNSANVGLPTCLRSSRFHNGRLVLVVVAKFPQDLFCGTVQGQPGLRMEQLCELE
jgi:hypothetical protein